MRSLHFLRESSKTRHSREQPSSPLWNRAHCEIRQSLPVLKELSRDVFNVLLSERLTPTPRSGEKENYGFAKPASRLAGLTPISCLRSKNSIETFRAFTALVPCSGRLPKPETQLPR